MSMDFNEEREFIIDAVTRAKVPTVHPDAANTIDIGRAVLTAYRAALPAQAEQVSAVRAARHPVQPLVIAEHGRVRFKRNHIVEHLAEGKLNDLAAMDFPQEDWEQLAQLIGYSLDGFGTLSYVTDETYERAAAQDPITSPSTATSNDTGALGEKGAE